MEKKVILIIEDEKNVVEVLRERLEQSGYRVIVSRNGENGWRKVYYDRPDLVILDIGLPRLDGFELCELIKSNKETKNIPVIMLTARDTMCDCEKGFCNGAETYITKPYVWERLLENIKKYIK